MQILENFRLESFNLIYLVSIIFISLPLMNYAVSKKRKSLKIFYRENLPSSFLSIKKELFLYLLFVLVLSFLIFSMLRPQGNPKEVETENKGRDLVFILDVSKSMLAQDLIPSRLEKAKQLILDIVNTLNGDRVGLLIFAGNTAVKCPLTLDYFYFENVLKSVHPSDLSKGGTNLGDAIRVVSNQLFVDFDKQYRDMILITDGEDQDSFPIEAAKASAEKKIKIHTIGIGAPEGAEIPILKQGVVNYLKHENNIVRSKLDENTLREIAKVTGGTYIPLKTKVIDMGAVYKKYIATDLKRNFKTKGVKIWDEYFQYFLIISILFLSIKFFVR